MNLDYNIIRKNHYNKLREKYQKAFKDANGNTPPPSKSSYLERYKKELSGYKKISANDLRYVPIGSKIAYIYKKTYDIKYGVLSSIIDKTIIELTYDRHKFKWHINTGDYILFYSIHEKDKLKDSLLNLIKTDFTEIRKSKK